MRDTNQNSEPTSKVTTSSKEVKDTDKDIQNGNQDLMKSSDSDLLEMEVQEEEIDEFAKALLDKKTEMAIYAEVMSEDTPADDKKAMDTAEIEEAMKITKKAEDTMADALDELRRERGQLPIDQEEENFAWAQSMAYDEAEDDFTTESLFARETVSAPTTVISGYNASKQRNYLEETEKRPIIRKKTKSRAARNKAKETDEQLDAEAKAGASTASNQSVNDRNIGKNNQVENSLSAEAAASKSGRSSESISSSVLNGKDQSRNSDDSNSDVKSTAAAVAASAAGTAALKAAENLEADGQPNQLKTSVDTSSASNTGAKNKSQEDASGAFVSSNDIYSQSHSGRKDSVIQSVYVEEQQEQAHKKRTWQLIGIIALIGLICIGAGFLYKTQIYDPAHTVTADQQKVYDTLTTYADKYDSLSDAQKKDMASMLSQYNDMTSAQKEDLNKYFEDKTGKSYVELAAAVTDQNKEQDASKDDADKSDADSETQNNPDGTDSSDASAGQNTQTPTDTTTPESTPAVGDQSQSYAPSYDQNTPAADSSTSVQGNGQTTDPSVNPAPDSGNNTGTNAGLVSQYQQEIAQLQTDRSNYVDFLASEGLPTEDDITASYDAQIAYYQNLLNSIQ